MYGKEKKKREATVIKATAATVRGKKDILTDGPKIFYGKDYDSRLNFILDIKPNLFFLRCNLFCE